MSEPLWQSEQEDMEAQALDYIRHRIEIATQLAEEILEALENSRTGWRLDSLPEVETLATNLEGARRILVLEGMLDCTPAWRQNDGTE